MAERIDDESVYLCISELKRGKIQFTDTTNAARLINEHSDWCDDNKENAISERFFTMRLKEMGYQQTRTSEAPLLGLT